MQVVHQVAATEDENAFLTQRRQSLGGLVVLGGILGFVDAQLHDRDVGLRKGMHEYGPGSVVQPPALVQLDRCRIQQLGDALRQLGRARRRVLDAIQLARKAAEIMNRSRALHGRHGHLRHVPMRRYAQDGARSREGRAEAAPPIGIRIAGEGVHRIAVLDEERRHSL